MKKRSSSPLLSKHDANQNHTREASFHKEAARLEKIDVPINKCNTNLTSRALSTSDRCAVPGDSNPGAGVNCTTDHVIAGGVSESGERRGVVLSRTMCARESDLLVRPLVHAFNPTPPIPTTCQVRSNELSAWGALFIVYRYFAYRGNGVLRVIAASEANSHLTIVSYARIYVENKRVKQNV